MFAADKPDPACHHDNMVNSEEILIKQCCGSLLADYAVAVDNVDASAMLDLFTADGVLSRGELTLRGAGEIPRILGNRADGSVMRHHITTNRITVEAPNRASGLCYYVLYNGTGPELPLAMEQPFSVGEWQSSFVCVDGQWKLSELHIRRNFVRKPAEPRQV